MQAVSQRSLSKIYMQHFFITDAYTPVEIQQSATYTKMSATYTNVSLLWRLLCSNAASMSLPCFNHFFLQRSEAMRPCSFAASEPLPAALAARNAALYAREVWHFRVILITVCVPLPLPWRDIFIYCRCGQECGWVEIWSRSRPNLEGGRRRGGSRFSRDLDQI